MYRLVEHVFKDEWKARAHIIFNNNSADIKKMLEEKPEKTSNETYYSEKFFILYNKYLDLLRKHTDVEIKELLLKAWNGSFDILKHIINSLWIKMYGLLQLELNNDAKWKARAHSIIDRKTADIEEMLKTPPKTSDIKTYYLDKIFILYEEYMELLRKRDESDIKDLLAIEWIDSLTMRENITSLWNRMYSLLMEESNNNSNWKAREHLIVSKKFADIEKMLIKTSGKADEKTYCSGEFLILYKENMNMLQKEPKAASEVQNSLMDKWDAAESTENNISSLWNGLYALLEDEVDDSSRWGQCAQLITQKKSRDISEMRIKKMQKPYKKTDNKEYYLSEISILHNVYMKMLLNPPKVVIYSLYSAYTKLFHFNENFKNDSRGPVLGMFKINWRVNGERVT